jgi:putative ABC transport system permease protein
MKYIRIALRNLNRQKKRTFLLGGAIGFGIMVIVLINAFTAGLVDTVKENFSHFFAGHIFITGEEQTASGKQVNVIRDDSVITETLEKLNISYSSIARRSRFTGTLVFGSRSIFQIVEGINFKEEEDFLENILLEGGSLENIEVYNSLILSRSMAEKLGVEIGESILVKLRTVTGQQNVGEFILIATIVDSGLLGSISAYANIEYVNELLNINPSEYQRMSIYLTDMVLIDEEAERLYEGLKKEELNLFDRKGDTDFTPAGHLRQFLGEEEEETYWEGTKYQLLTLNDILADFISIIGVLDTIGLVILLILLVIITVGITNTFRMIIYERVGEIGTMRALGIQRYGVRAIFLLEALFLALAGALVGFILAGIAIFGLKFITVDSGSPLFLFMLNGHPHFKVILQQAVVNLLIVAAFTLLAAFFPARKAALLKPADALRKQY